MNATFGNAAELILTLFALKAGLLDVVKASLTGSIIGNTLLVLGTSLLAGGARHGRQHYDPQATSLNAAMMILAVAGLYLPATFASVVREQPVIEELSGFVAGVLLLTYLAYLLYAVFLGQPSGVRSRAVASTREATADPRAGRKAGRESWSGEGAWGRGKAPGAGGRRSVSWPVLRSVRRSAARSWSAAWNRSPGSWAGASSSWASSSCRSSAMPPKSTAPS